MALARREFVALAVWPWAWFRRGPQVLGTRFRRVGPGTDGRRYIWIHGNEQTARDVLTQHMRQRNGRAYLIASTERNIPVDRGALDPNRMFSRAGADANVRNLNPAWTTAQVNSVLDRLESDRKAFLNAVLPRDGNVIIALHNNGPGYSIQDEIPISDAVSFADDRHPDEFMLCTTQPDFDVLAGGPFNVVLQNRKPEVDDGSLSRLCAARGIRYVNIEAAHGAAEAQRRMLLWVERVL